MTSPPPGGSGAPPPAGYPPYPPPAYAPPGYAPPGAPPGYGYRPPPPPALSPGGQPLASFLDRFVAYLLDGLVFGGAVLVLLLPPFLIAFFALLPDLELDEYGQPVNVDLFQVLGPLLLLELGLIVLALVIAYVYYVEIMFRSGQTIGKKVMKIRIVPVDPAASLTRTMAAKRYLVQHVAGSLVPFFTYLDGFWQLWDKPYQQCLHDKWAQTVVVKIGPA